jgi:hypothetical protein
MIPDGIGESGRKVHVSVEGASCLVGFSASATLAISGFAALAECRLQQTKDDEMDTVHHIPP